MLQYIKHSNICRIIHNIITMSQINIDYDLMILHRQQRHQRRQQVQQDKKLQKEAKLRETQLQKQQREQQQHDKRSQKEARVREQVLEKQQQKEARVREKELEKQLQEEARVREKELEKQQRKQQIEQDKQQRKDARVREKELQKQQRTQQIEQDKQQRKEAKLREKEERLQLEKDEKTLAKAAAKARKAEETLRLKEQEKLLKKQARAQAVLDRKREIQQQKIIIRQQKKEIVKQAKVNAKNKKTFERQHNKTVDAAMLRFCINSGMKGASSLDENVDHSNLVPSPVIDSVIENCVNKYLTNMNAYKHVACASCGVSKFNNPNDQQFVYHPPGPASLAPFLIKPDDVPYLLLNKAHSNYKLHTSYYHLSYYHLYKDLVNEDGSFYTCKRLNTCTPYSISTMDMGTVPSHLPMLNLGEKMLLARRFLFKSIIKIHILFEKYSVSINSSTISVSTNAIESLLSELPRTNFDKDFTVLLFGSAKLIQEIRNGNYINKSFLDRFQINIENVFEWLYWLKDNNDFYKDIVIVDNAEIREKMANFHLDLLKGATVDDKSTEKDMKKLSDDVAKDSGLPFKSDLVCNPFQHVATTNTNILDYLQTVASNKDNDDDNIIIPVHQDPGLMNDFSENNIQIMQSFPWMFPTGRELKCQGSLPTGLVKHFLQFYDRRFSDHDFIFFLFDQSRRHACCRAYHATIKNNPSIINLWYDLIHDENFTRNVRQAIKYPDSPFAKELIQHVKKILNVVNNKIPLSANRDVTHLNNIQSINHYRSTAALFVTVSPDIQNNVLLLSFFKDQHKNNPLDVFKIKFDYHTRLSLVVNDPVLASQMYDLIIKNLEKFLFNFKTSSKSSHCIDSFPQGVLGVVHAIIKKTETQDKGLLHSHWLVYTSYNQLLIRQLVTTFCSQKIVDAITEYVDSIQTSSIHPSLLDHHHYERFNKTYKSQNE